jgi:hypothetical protein
MWHPISTEVGNRFVDKLRSLGWYSSLADSDHGAFFIFYKKNEKEMVMILFLI